MAAPTPVIQPSVSRDIYANAFYVMGPTGVLGSVGPSGLSGLGGATGATGPTGPSSGSESFSVASTISNILVWNGSAYVAQSSIIGIGQNSAAIKTTTQLNTIAIGTSAGYYNQNAFAIALGMFAGNSTQGTNGIAIGCNAGSCNQGIQSVALGRNAGNRLQASRATALGDSAGQFNQGAQCVAIGWAAGQNSQGSNGIAIGNNASYTSQGVDSIAIGRYTGAFSGSNAIAIGAQAGSNAQQSNAIAIGYSAGFSAQETAAIAIGFGAGSNAQRSNSIIINANNVPLNGDMANALYIHPIRSQTSNNIGALLYDTTTKEISYNSSKTFVIDHPLDKERYLVHACLEGPEAGVYYRGKTTISNTSVRISLPPYATQIATDFTVHITPIGASRMHSVSEVEDGAFTICGEGTFHWVVYGCRTAIEVEPLKSAVDVKGHGPYRWI